MSRLARSISSILVLVIIFSQVGCMQKSTPQQNAGETKKIELRLAHFFPGTHPVETELVSDLAQNIKEASKGEITITSYPGETLGKAPEIYNGVVNGVADIGISCFSYTRGRFPMLEAFELPGITYKNSKVASKVAWEGIQLLDPDEVKDTKLLMVIATGPGDLFTKVPVRNMNDLKGLELRATGLSAKTLQILGATPVAMAQSEAYEALSKGVVKGNLSPVEVLKGWRHAEVTKYLTLTPFLYNTLFFVTMNLDKWNSLTTEQQKIVENMSEKTFEEIGLALWDSQNEVALDWAVKETGLEVIELTQEESNKWISNLEPIKQDYITEMNNKGLNGQEIMDKVKGLADKYNDVY